MGRFLPWDLGVLLRLADPFLLEGRFLRDHLFRLSHRALLDLPWVPEDRYHLSAPAGQARLGDLPAPEGLQAIQASAIPT